MDVMSEAEATEIAVRMRRAEGTPCTEENFCKWKANFDKEMAAKQETQEEEQASLNEKVGKKKKKDEVDEQDGRLTGYEQFTQKLGLVNMDALEQAALEAENEDLDEDLFDDDDDLDDLDFSDEEDDEDYDSEEEEVDI